MKTFKNKHFKGVDPECTNVIFCQADTAPSDNWIECEEAELKQAKYVHQLYIQAGVRFFGC